MALHLPFYLGIFSLLLGLYCLLLAFKIIVPGKKQNGAKTWYEKLGILLKIAAILMIINGLFFLFVFFPY